MTTSESGSLARCIRGISAGVMALAIAATFSLPTAVLAKEKPASKVEVSKKSSKKLSKKSSKSKALAKKAKSVKKSARKSAPVSRKKSTAKQAETPANFVWKPSAEPKQAYYVIPHSVAGHVAGKSQNSPDFTQTSATPAAIPALPTQAAAPKPQAKKAPTTGDVHQVGTASYYNDKFDGGRTASGERFDQDKMTCAHGSLPFGCRIRVTNMRNQQSVEVKVNDRGGFSKHGRVIDLSKAAAKEIGMMASGTAKVMIEILE